MQHFSLHGFLNTNEKFDEISEKLNDEGRDDALFRAMKIEDDDVKLAVVDCLYVVPMDEFEEREVADIVMLLRSCKDIESGETENVLATIFQLLTKFVLDDYDTPRGIHSKVFQDFHGESAVSIGLMFLELNTARQVDMGDEETDGEKYALS